MYRKRKGMGQKLFISITVPIISLCISFLLFYTFMPRATSTKAVVTQVNTTQPVVTTSSVTPPTKMRIDSIKVAAAVYPVGIAANGDMDIKEDPTELAWYQLGPKPGEEGSAVVAGHYGWKDGVPSVFNDLNKLTKGDTVTSVGSDGKVKTFTVTHTALYAPNQDATAVFRSDDGKSHLNLVTCQGSWNKSAQSYTERLVVFTDLVE